MVKKTIALFLLCFSLAGAEKEQIVTFSRQQDKITISLIPDKKYIHYYLYIQEGLSVRKRKITSRTVTILDPEKITAIQITGSGVNGPETLAFYPVSSWSAPQFIENLPFSINSIRKKLKIPAVTREDVLDSIARTRLGVLRKEGLIHISSSEGSFRHARQIGLPDKMGETLFCAKSEKRAWDLLMKSPAHLYTILTPAYRKSGLAMERERNALFMRSDYFF